jgi:hypothetical protein
MKLPTKGDRVTVQGRSDSYTVLHQLNGVVVLTLPTWPMGANIRIQLHELATINGSPCQFPEPSRARRR